MLEIANCSIFHGHHPKENFQTLNDGEIALDS